MTDDYARIERAIRYLEEHAPAQPRLADVAAHVGLSEHHFQRLFRRWAGVSPKRFLQFLTAEHAKQLLHGSRSLLAVTYGAGLSSPSRLHELLVNVHGMTPAEYRAAGRDVRIRYGFHATPFGECLIAVTQRGVCTLAFVAADERDAALADLHARWSRAGRVEDAAATGEVVRRIFGTNGRAGESATVDLHLLGTNFQLRVWEALLRVPPGVATTYGELAGALGIPKSARAVGSAVASNAVAYLVPCHRVIRSTGAFGEYRWGRERKRALLGWESARCGAGVE